MMLCRTQPQLASAVAAVARAARPSAAAPFASLQCRSFAYISHIQQYPRLPTPRSSGFEPVRFSSSSTTATSTATSSPPSPTSTPAAGAAASSAPEKPDYLNDAEGVIWDRLVAEFAPAELLVQDISGGCGSMYGIEISSEKFRGLGMLKQQRMVNHVLADLMKDWHGVQLRTRVP